MISKSSYALVGAFVLILGAVFIWGVLWISSGGPPRDYQRYVMYMTDSVTGLNVDALLTFRGINVGKVEQLTIDSEHPERIRIQLLVREGTPITEDTVAMLEYQGLTGIASINLTGGGPESPPLERKEGEDYPVITARSSLFQNLDTTLSELLGSLIETSSRLSSLLDQENRENISRSIENIAEVTDKFVEQSKQLDGIIENLSATLENTRTASIGFPDLVSQFSLSANKIAQTADQIGGLSENLATDLNATTLPELSVMVHELRLASENLRKMSETLADDPSVLLYGRPQPKPGPGEN